MTKDISGYCEMDNGLKRAYKIWLEEIERKSPELLGEEYSNPYYMCVPKGWIESNIRIMIVGEEGFGKWGRGKSEGVCANDIEKIQTFCWNSLASYLDWENVNFQLYPNAYLFDFRNSPFWQRARKFYKYGICAWSNLDKIHILADKKCALSDSDKIKLYSIDTRILQDEIDVLNPTHIVFFGWYGISLQHELPELFAKIYPNGLGDNTLWQNSVVNLKYNQRNYIFSYHPNWGIRRKGYENKVIEVFNKTI